MLNVEKKSEAVSFHDPGENRSSGSSSSFKQIPIAVVSIEGDAVADGDAVSARVPGDSRYHGKQPTRLQRLRWAGARVLFIGYISLALTSFVGGYLTAPVMSHLFFGDWRFWRYWKRGWRLLPHGWGIFWLMLRREGRFMFSVPLTSPPQSMPDQARVRLSPGWDHGSTCGSCRQCCRVSTLDCPVLDPATGLCSGYDSFYWRYFNCGRYPSRQMEIDYYGCGKWQLHERPVWASASPQ